MAGGVLLSSPNRLSPADADLARHTTGRLMVQLPRSYSIPRVFVGKITLQKTKAEVSRR